MREIFKDKVTQIICVVTLLVITIPNLISIKYAIYTPDDFRLSLGEDCAGNKFSMIFAGLINPVIGLNYRLLRVTMAGLLILFVISFFVFLYLLVQDFGIDKKNAFVFSSSVVGAFLFFKEYYEFFFWWTGTVFYELPVILILWCLILYLWGKQKNTIVLEVISLVLVFVVIIANFNSGTISWIKNNYDDELNFFKAIYYVFCVVEAECKHYIKDTGYILVLGCMFFWGLKISKTLQFVENIQKKVWWVVFPLLIAFPSVFLRDVYNLDRLPNRSVALIDMFLIVYLSLAALGVGGYVGTKSVTSENFFFKIVYVFLVFCTIVFVVDLKEASDVRLCRNLALGQIQNYSDTWSSIYYVCDTTEEQDLVIETDVIDRVEGCCYPKLRSKTSSEKNEVTARFFGLNTISLIDTNEN